MILDKYESNMMWLSWIEFIIILGVVWLICTIASITTNDTNILLVALYTAVGLAILSTLFMLRGFILLVHRVLVFCNKVKPKSKKLAGEKIKKFYKGYSQVEDGDYNVTYVDVPFCKNFVIEMERTYE